MMKVDLKGRINNIPLSPSDGLLPLFEAVVNSIQAIEDRQNAGEDVNGEIIVTIHRSEKYGQQELESGIRSLPPIIGFSIKDNGIGFNQINFDSFNTSDSTYKHERGGKGVGHFSWAKVFDITHIRSVFVQDGKHLLREFDFTINNSDEQVHSEKLSEVDDDIYTIVHLDGFKEEYFNIIKNDTISEIDSIKDNPNLYASVNYAKHMYKNTPNEYSTIPSKKDIENIQSCNEK